MYTHSISHRSRSHKLPGLIIILSCLTGAILAQTFQYSRGWTNGRKRTGPASTLIVPPSAPASALYQNLDDSNPCSQLQRIRFLLGARNPQQFFFPCDTWRDVPEAADNVSERFKRATGTAEENAQEN